MSCVRRLAVAVLVVVVVAGRSRRHRPTPHLSIRRPAVSRTAVLANAKARAVAALVVRPAAVVEVSRLVEVLLHNVRAVRVVVVGVVEVANMERRVPMTRPLGLRTKAPLRQNLPTRLRMSQTRMSLVPLPTM